MAAHLPFHPLINAWFSETYGNPTPVQAEAWPRITKGEHVLAIAPTGSGKTLTGFLAAISRFADGTYDAGKLSVLYVSPLKALNEDIRRNLTLPLEGIRARFEKAGEALPDIRVQTRSGDTPQHERRRLLSMPPSILALTPESLAILLLNPKGRERLASVRYVILDEIHSALGSKRGCFLSCQIDRLSLVAGEFQRVALSATVKPPEAAADFTGGLRKSPSGSGYEKRNVSIVSPVGKKELDFRVLFPEEDETAELDTPEAKTVSFGKRYTKLVTFILERIKAYPAGLPGGNTILVFAGSRRTVERIAYLLNQAAANDNDFAGRPIAYAHHGSLSKDVRREVEKALAAGAIPCVVATSSLELGIDIGGVEEVILAGSPHSAAQTLQRVGRSGHSVGMTSRGWLLPFHGLDLLQAAALSGAVEERELEETAHIENPLDILAQIILALCAEKDWNEDELFQTIRGFYVYQSLSRANYDGVLRMLAGAYEGTRLRELKRRIYRDAETRTLSAAPGALPLLYTSGGVIASRGYYSMRIAPTAGHRDNKSDGAGTKIGELDEEFVWERRIGDCFEFGSRTWRIITIGNEAVEVVPVSAGTGFTPFWRADMMYRGSLLSRRILEILDGKPEQAKLPTFNSEARDALANFLASQKSVQGNIPLPGPSFIPIEIVDDLSGRSDAYLVILYTFRGGGVNLPLSMALSQDLELRHGTRFDSTADDNAIFIKLPRTIPLEAAEELRKSLHRLCQGGGGEERFRQRLESSGVFGAAFREAAERSLLLPRSPFGKRIPLWVMRQRAKRLFDAASPYRDFPVAAEAWRSCLVDQLDMAGFRALLDSIQSGELAFDFFKTRQASPFAQNIVWAETNMLVYTYDERPDLLGSPSGHQRSLSDEVIAEALGNAEARPSLKAELVGDFCSRLRRELSGWAPEDTLTLCEWVKERIAIPTNGKDDEWERLMEHVPPELAKAWQDDKSLGGKLVFIKRKAAGTGAIVHRERAKQWEKTKAAELAADYLAQWLRYQGPLSLSRIMNVFGLEQSEAEEAVQALLDQGDLIRDVAVHNETGLICDRENLELLLRLGRRKQRLEIKERPARFIVPFLARRQGLLPAGISVSFEQLAGVAAPAKLWETEFFPCRCPSFSGEMLEKEIREGRLIWYGAGKEKAAFCRAEDLELVLPVSPPPRFGNLLRDDFFDTARTFWEIKDAVAANSAGINAVAETLWEEVWRGSLSSDSWESMRLALQNGFASIELTAELNTGRRRGSSRIPRALRDRWRAGPPVRGNWFSLAADRDEETASLLEEEELNRERVRLPLARWGILSRPLLEREAPCLSWSRLLPAMRRMELAGELMAGRFFDGINSLQFAPPRIALELEEAEAERGIYWMNAADPASPAGLDIQGIINQETQVRRLPGSRLCFRGAELLAVSTRNGKDLEIFIPSDDPDIADALAFLKIPRTRKVLPESKIVIEKINGKSAGLSAYASILAALGFVKDRGRMVLW